MSNQPQQESWGSPPQSGPADSGFDFIGMLQRRFWIIFLCVLLAAGGGAFWFWKSDVVFSSVARTHIYFQNPNVSIIGKEGFATSNTIRSHDELLRSESVLNNAAIEIMRLIEKETEREHEILEDPTAGKDPIKAVDEKDEGKDKGFRENTGGRKPFAYLRDKSVRQISNHLLSSIKVMQARDDPNIYQVVYSGPSQRDCHVVLGVVIEQYSKHLTEKYKSEGNKVVDQIEAAQVIIENDLKEKQRKLSKWRNDNKDVLKKYAEGFKYTVDGKKVNRYREEAQVMYEEIQKLEAERDKVSDDQVWIKEALAANLSQQEILTHIDKFGEWLQIEQRKSSTQSGPKNEAPVPFVEPEPPIELIQARFNVTRKKSEIQDLIERGFGANYPGRRKLENELALIEENVKLLEETQKRRVAIAKESYEAMKKFAEAKAAESLDTGKLPKILNEIDLVGLHKSYLEQKLVRLDHDLGQLKGERKTKVAEAEIVDALLQDEVAMENEIAMQDSLHKSIIQKINEVNIEKNNGGYVLDVINSPSYAKQTEPSIFKIFAISTFIGVVVGAGLGYLVEVADKTFRSPAEIAQQLGMQVMGHVPILSTRKIDLKESKLNESLIAFHLPKSQQAESFRAIRTNLFFNAQGKDSQIVQVTSPTPGDGKSTLAANLAISLAQSGKKVLLLDADLRRPTVEYLFGTDVTKGFSSLLSGTCELDDVLVNCEVDGLQLLPVGKRPSNPSELLTSSKLFDLFETLREKFDFIIVDSPPMLAVTDPCAVAARADGVILAMRIKKNVKLSAGRAKEVLDSVGANIMGIVVNGAGMVQGHYSNSAAYGYGYGYGYGPGYAGNYYSYGYDDGEASYYYDDDYKPTTTRR